MWDSLAKEFTLNFIKDNRWQYLANGLLITLQITFFSVLMGLVIGILESIIRIQK